VTYMYAEYGCLETAVSLFHKTPLNNVNVSWNVMSNECFYIMVSSGFLHNEFFQLFRSMAVSYKLSPMGVALWFHGGSPGQSGFIQEV
jgi:hypothetical protein